MTNDQPQDGEWQVALGVRRPRAIGHFWKKWFQVRAESQAQAIEFAQQDAHDAGLETRETLEAKYIGKWAERKETSDE